MDQDKEGKNGQPAFLLLGPTGAGKTPLGDALEAHGINGRRCFHFDFGENLRAIAYSKGGPLPEQEGVASGVSPDSAGAMRAGWLRQPTLQHGDTDTDSVSFSASDRAFLRAVLESGALLERETFYIAHNILLSFIQQRGIEAQDLVLMNGLPRHVGQAEDVDAFVDIQRVIFLECKAETVHERIILNSGGDRTERADDSLQQVENKLNIFRERTLPLLDHYRQKGVSISPVQVNVDTTAMDIVQLITRED